MVNAEWLLEDLVNFFYHLIWLVYLIRKHYGQVTTKAGHVFELNVQLNITINFFLYIFTVDLEVLPHGIISDILHATMFFSYLVAIASSQIETAIFLKTLNVNTIMTYTAGRILLLLFIFCFCVAVLVTLVQDQPSSQGNRYEKEYCEFFTPRDFYQLILLSALILVIVLTVIGLAIFRSHQVRKISDHHGVEGEIEVGCRDTLNGTPPQDRLFNIQMNRDLHSNAVLNEILNWPVTELRLACD